MTPAAFAFFMPGMVRRGTKPNRRVEESLHHGPVTGMLDMILLEELRDPGNGSAEELAAGQRVAMRISWELHALTAFRIPRF